MKGSCLCGAVQYEAGEVQCIQFCHRRTCQIQQGAPYIAGGAVKRTHLLPDSGRRQAVGLRIQPRQIPPFLLGMRHHAAERPRRFAAHCPARNHTA